MAVYRLKRFFILLFAIGISLWGWTVLTRMARLWDSTRDWETTTATVEEFSTRKLPRTQPFSRRRSRDLFRYSLRYQFQVDGEEYTGDSLSPANNHSIIDRQESNRYSAKLLPGSRVTIIYWPENPGEKSYLEPVPLQDVLVRPGGMLLLGLWILYLLRKTRVRRVPKRVLQAREDPNSPRWHAIYQSVLEMDQVTVQGTAWYAQSAGLTQWPKSRVALVATPNTIAVIRGPYTINGFFAATLTALLEFFVSTLIAVAHAGGFLLEWLRRHSTWREFESGLDASQIHPANHTADIVPIDHTLVYGYDARKHELWFRLPNRTVDDCIQLAPDLIQEIEQFIGYVQLMQNARHVPTDDHLVLEGSPDPPDHA